METEILDETKTLEEIEAKLRKVKATRFKKSFGMKLMSKKSWKDKNKNRNRKTKKSQEK